MFQLENSNFWVIQKTWNGPHGHKYLAGEFKVYGKVIQLMISIALQDLLIKK
jgi:hypothetical protein